MFKSESFDEADSEKVSKSTVQVLALQLQTSSHIVFLKHNFYFHSYCKQLHFRELLSFVVFEFESAGLINRLKVKSWLGTLKCSASMIYHAGTSLEDPISARATYSST